MDKRLVEESIRSALSGMTGGPALLMDAVVFYARQGKRATDRLENTIIERLRTPNDEVKELLHDQLGRWDWEGNAPWTGATSPNTPARRQRIYQLLGVGPSFKKALDQYLEPYQGAKAVVIDDPAQVPDWYTFEFRRKHDFYWSRLRRFLKEVRVLHPDAVNSVGSSADRILERLGEPASSDLFAARGLVVGYVQSGKTTNFTAVIAKAIDAGYRLIVVLSGTTNLLRNQTQRRLDMELVGVENILPPGAEAEHDYVEDDGWPGRFITYGRRPSLLGHVDINRLTTQEDFKSKDGGLNPLAFHFEKHDRRKPLYDRQNLNHAGARIAVVKKQFDRLGAFIRELKQAGTEQCAEIPTLIIDDESDQASVNTVNPEKVRDRNRSRINERIVEILSLLPRAQYLGYTATPFANVFVDAHDEADIYPRHFIISLERPKGYMGAREFHDFAPVASGRLSNKAAYIRDVPKPDDPKNDRLLEAMDAFVLAGAIKKFREKRDKTTFKHHTMLVHSSMSTSDQERLVKEIDQKWKNAGYGMPGPDRQRLESLLEDFREVWADRGRSLGWSFPKTYAELVPSLGSALDEIRNGKVVLMVNSAEGADVPDFDAKAGVWKIIVGGAKLSRGYTIEGLTISYFRRRSKMQDTLMQMGRWFGYRPGYEDLVRLYIGRAERDGKNTIDLYKAFEAMCRDEEDFRAQLAMYEGKGGITPQEVPALVFNTYPALRPTSRNKMFRTRVAWAAFDYREPTSQANTTGRDANARLFSRLIGRMRCKDARVKPAGQKTGGFDIKWSEVGNSEIVSLLKGVTWEGKSEKANPISAEIAYLSRAVCPIEGWLFVAPQVNGEADPWEVGDLALNCVARSRIEASPRIGVFSSPEHVRFAKWLVGEQGATFDSALKPRKKTGVLLFYPTRERLEKGTRTGAPVMGFAIVLPRDDRSDMRIAFTADI